ncbi:helix-turn-helix domain-containing protein [Kribbella sp. CA-245084]|uniref:helix-turn-helix domain-containing protein n=1 Tax=Kribbella sp. CA-245084 TaxID=3239940 RepID=UPI003D8B04DC
MSKARLVVTAIETEGRTVAEVVAAYGVSRSWVYELLARYRTEGEAAFEPRSRRPKTSPTAVPQSTVDLIITVRKQLIESGLDAGPDTIAWHLRHRHQITVSVSTIARTLTRQGLVVPQPKKRPKSSYLRFQAEQPNETWQSDFTHYPLADGTDTETITWLDDHSRYALHVTAHRPPPARSCSRRSLKPLPSMAIQPPCSPTTASSTPPASPAAAAGATASRPNYAASTSSRRTPDPTTPPPAERSNGSSRR